MIKVKLKDSREKLWQSAWYLRNALSCVELYLSKEWVDVLTLVPMNVTYWISTEVIE